MKSWEKASLQHKLNTEKRRKMINCKVCGKKLLVRPSYSIRKKFCSMKCMSEDRKINPKKPRKGKLVNCSKCKKSIYRRQSTLIGKKNKGKFYFCSKKCMNEMDFGGALYKKCKNCNKEYRTFKSAFKWRGSSFCSYKCKFEYEKGKNHPSWKGGSSYKKHLWQVFSLYIRSRDGGLCISCGKKGKITDMDAGHYIPKTAGLNLYFDEKNVNCQCTYCNRWLHGNLSKYAIALIKKYGEGILEELDNRRTLIRKITIPEYQTLIKNYEEKLRTLKPQG